MIGVRATEAALLSLLTACGAAPSVGPTASTPATGASASSSAGTAPATASPSAQPASPTPTLLADAVAEVVTTDLVMRSAPGVGQDSEILDRLLQTPQLLYLLDGPVGADGYDWYLAAPFRFDSSPSNPPNDPIGWVAAGSRDDEPWIAPTQLDCPAPTLEVLSAQSPIANLACFGDQQLAFEAVFNGCFSVSPQTIVPPWLTSSGCSILVVGSEPTALPTSGALVVRGGGGPPDEPGTRVLVRGHFDDPEARTCQLLATGALPLGVASTILWCRTQFVTTDF